MNAATLHTILVGALGDHERRITTCPDNCWHYTAHAELARFRQCKRCGHLWQTDGQPKTCAGCRSPYWDDNRRSTTQGAA